jgi:hypothetical protein
MPASKGGWWVLGCVRRRTRPAGLACAPLSVVLADGGAPAGLALAPVSVVLMRAFLPRLRRPGPLLPSPPLPACRFPLAPALSALAPLLAMPTLVLSPASAPITALSFSASAPPKVVVRVRGYVDAVGWFHVRDRPSFSTSVTIVFFWPNCSLALSRLADSPLPRV